MTRLLAAGLVLLSLLSFSGCGLATLMGPGLFVAPNNGSGSGSGSGSSVSFNLAGAKAIASSVSSSRSASARSGSTNDSLVKILEDGSIQSLIESSGGYLPTVAFLSTGDDGSVYVCFSSVTSLGGSYAQFIRIYPADNHFDVLWPPAGADPWSSGSVATWSWWGVDSDPLAKGWDGSLYFKVTKYVSSSLNEDIYRYNPVSGGNATKLTPDNAGLSITNFLVDKKDHLFLLGSNSAGSFMRLYTVGTLAPTNIFYSSAGASSTWVRGYTTSPDGNYVILNGNGIRGMNGILKVSIAADSSLTYDLVYANANNSGSWVWLTKGYTDTWDSPTTVIKQLTDNWSSMSYGWEAAVKTGAVMDRAKFLQRVQAFFHRTGSSPLTLTTLGETLLPATGWTDAELNTQTLDSLSVAASSFKDANNAAIGGIYGTTKLSELIQSYPEPFLRACFNEKLFKDWINDPAQATLKTVNFDYVGAMMWASDGLYALYGYSSWGSSGGTSVIKLLAADGTQDLKLVTLKHSDKNPTNLKIVGDWLYYRYDVLDAFNQATGVHKLARKNFTTGVALDDEELYTAADLVPMEILTYDVAEDNSQVYFCGFDISQNVVVGGKILTADKSWSKLDTVTKLKQVRIIN